MQLPLAFTRLLSYTHIIELWHGHRVGTVQHLGERPLWLSPLSPPQPPTADPSLLLVSTFPPVPPLVELLKLLGGVKFILAPNSMHCSCVQAMRDEAVPW